MNTHNFNKLLITPEKEGRPGKHEIRIITYNIHSCVDKSRNVNPEIIAEIIETSRADIVCLQEVDEHRFLSENTNQAKILADHLKMDYVFFPVEKTGLHTFGLAILSHFSLNESYYNVLPNLFPRLKPRRRGAIRASIQTPAGPIHMINAHLSLFKLERRRQLKTLLGKDWLLAVPPDEPIIFCGDLNAGPLSRTYRTLTRLLTDVQKDRKNPSPSSSQPTFHSRSPLFRIDHIFVSHHFQTINVEVKNTPETRTASDHLPLIADLEL
ncbi:MAG: endonuclease/exonuclease/phosphatase family protein [Desulfobacterales bacterium]|jgi:endonuclease/exonuclease/phosphatase family metal-dependent hydrolase